LAGEVLDHYTRQRSGAGGAFTGYWDEVTRAEALLLQGKLAQARRTYQRAMAIYRHIGGHTQTTREQIDRILPRLGLSASAKEYLSVTCPVRPIETVRIGVTGQLELATGGALRQRLQEALDAIQERIGPDVCFELLSPLAEGADRLAAEVVRQRDGALLHVILPLELTDYVGDSPQTEDGFRDLLDYAAEIEVVKAEDGETGGVHWAASRYLVDHCDVLLAIWDGRPPAGPGGTSEAVAHARRIGRPLAWIQADEPYTISYERFDDLTRFEHKGKYMTYGPKPLDTSQVELPGSIVELVERLAKHNHDVWAVKRVNDGWRYGPERNDAAKTHPDLVPYEELPESEKDYDRSSSREMIKAVISLGFSIRKA
ncbi:hypothetical protein LCGC14_2345260, partial [marine sediment metagenome]